MNPGEAGFGKIALRILCCGMVVLEVKVKKNLGDVMEKVYSQDDSISRGRPIQMLNVFIIASD